jgi:hypothetical protein
MGLRALFGWIWFCTALLMAGCGQSSGIGTAPVSGKVTYKGQPVEGATISFIPDASARPATAISASGGSYRLTTLDSPGAMPGQYTVVVRKTEIAGDPAKAVTMEEALKLNNRPPPQPKELLPAKYGDAAKSPLKVEVKAGARNVFDLQLVD